MNKLYSYVASTLLATASLTSCSTSQYAFKPGTSPYHDASTHAQALPEVVSPKTDVTTFANVASANTLTNPTVVKTAAPLATTNIIRPAASAQKQLSLAKRTVVAKMEKQLAKSLRQRHESAEVSQEQSRAGRAGIVIGVGVLLILIGGLIGGSNIVVTIGGIAFVVGLILLIIALVSGN